MDSAGTRREGDVQAKGHNLHYLEWGEGGEDMVLLHGFGNVARARNFDPICAALSEDLHVVAFDLLGHGGSDDPKEPTGYEEHAEVIREGARRLGLTRYALLGYSFGGRVSTFHADGYPGEVSKFILVDIHPETHPDPEPLDLDLSVPRSFAGEEEALDWYMSGNPGASREAIRPLVKVTLRLGIDGRLYLPSHSSRKANLRRSGDGWSVFSRLKMPVLLIRGSESPDTTDDIVSRMREAKPDLIVETIQGAGHDVPFSHSEEFVRAVREFLTA